MIGRAPAVSILVLIFSLRQALKLGQEHLEKLLVSLFRKMLTMTMSMVPRSEATPRIQTIQNQRAESTTLKLCQYERVNGSLMTGP